MISRSGIIAILAALSPAANAIAQNTMLREP